jgi:hypothetical protein
VFVPVDIRVEIAKVKEKGCPFAVLDKGQSAVLNQTSQLPFTDREVVGSLPGSEKAAVVVRWGGRKRHRCKLQTTDIDNLQLA